MNGRLLPKHRKIHGFAVVKNKALALLRRCHDIQGMKQARIYFAITLFAWSLQSAVAQVIPPGGSIYNPPPPPPPPPPKIEVPAIPRMDELPKRSYAPIAPQQSFGERIGKCLDDAAAAGLGPAERTTYSRNCATR